MRTIKLLITLVLLGLSYNSFAQCAYGIPPPCVPASDPGWGKGGYTGGGGSISPDDTVIAVDVSVYPFIVAKSGGISVKKAILQGLVGDTPRHKIEERALKACQSKGGTQCQILYASSNACVAVAANPNGITASSDYLSVHTAKKAAMANCEKTYGENCQIVFSSKVVACLLQ